MSMARKKANMSYLLLLLVVYSQYSLRRLIARDTSHLSDEDNELLLPMMSENHEYSQKAILVVVPGLGDHDRIATVKNSIHSLEQSLMKENTYSLSCVVYVWNMDILEETKEALADQSCNVVYHVGLWTDHMVQVNATVTDQKNEQPPSHVAVLIDDVDASGIKLSSFMNIMSNAEYGVASAAVPQWHYEVMRSRNGCLAHRSDYVDVLFTVFALEHWLCWQKHLDPPVNQYGWGYDVTFADTCGPTIGIIDQAIVSHDGQCESGGDCTRSYNETKAMNQLWNWIMVTAKKSSVDDARAHWRYVTQERPNEFPWCDIVDQHAPTTTNQTSTAVEVIKEAELPVDSVLPASPVTTTTSDVSFILADDGYYGSSEHRGGWRAILDYLILDAGSLENPSPPTATHGIQPRIESIVSAYFGGNDSSSKHEKQNILLLDITENWFAQDYGVVEVPWLGITHWCLEAPTHWNYMMLQSIFSHPDFLQSMKYNVGLVLLASDQVDHVTQMIDANLRNHSLSSSSSFRGINVCPTFHPLAVESTASLYDPVTDLEATFAPKRRRRQKNRRRGQKKEERSGVVLLGQQYRRLATIHQLKTSRPKIWMPGSGKNDIQKALQERVDVDLRVENVTRDDSVQVTYTKSFDDYDQMVKRNIVIVDLWCATANNAVLEAISLQTPFLIRQLPSTVEYLGPDYPLLFRDFGHLQSLFEDEAKLKNLMLEAHTYLKEMNKDPFRMNAFDQALRDCGAAGLAARQHQEQQPARRTSSGA